MMLRVILLFFICLLSSIMAHADGSSGTRTYVASSSGTLSNSAVSFTPTTTNKTQIYGVTVHFSAATSAGVSIILDASQGATYDTVIGASSGSITDYYFQPTSPLILEAADDIRVTLGADLGKSYTITVRGDLK